jgi:F-type H+-transporting ATPase subunit a
MLGSITKVFAAGESGIHVSLKAEPVFMVGDVTVTNSMLYGFIVATFMALVLILVAKKSSVKPKKGLIAVVEMIVEFVINLLEGAFGNRKQAVKYAPIFAVFFFFILFSNIMGLIPIVGPGIYVPYEGINIPIFRPFTADLNGTLVMAVIAIITVQVLSIRSQGFKGHMQHYFTNKPWNPINFFIGILEILGEFTRILSLALRLFLNTAVGEILIAVFTSLILANGRTPLAVIPIILFELLVAGIQAYVFTVLSATYLALAISHAHPEEEHHVPEAQKVEGLTA